MTRQANELYEFGPFRVDPREYQLSRDGEALPLTPKAFETLLVLIQNNGHLMLKDELMKALWPDSFVEEVNLSQNISMLRKVLGDTPQNSRYIVTVPGKGYRFVGEVRTFSLEEDSPDDLIVESRSRTRVTIEENCRLLRVPAPFEYATTRHSRLRSRFRPPRIRPGRGCSIFPSMRITPSTV